MSDPHGRKVPSGGLARSIDALFRSPGEEVVWEEVEDTPDERRRTADPEAFRGALEAFVTSDPLDRDGLAQELRAQSLPLRDRAGLDTLADGVERLALAPTDPPDPALPAMARQLVTPGVASRIAARLGAATDEERRDRLMQVCTVVGHEMALALSDALTEATDREARRTFIRAMAALDDEAMPILEEMMESGRAFQVRNAVAVLGELGGERALELVTPSLAHPDAAVRREAVRSLARLGGEDAGMLVYGLIEDPDPGVRLAAATAAGRLRVERALRPLLTLLEEEDDPPVLVAVLGALGRLGDPGAVPSIEKRAVSSFFSRPSNEVRIAAYRALHAIGTPHARGLLEQAREDKDPQVRTFVRKLVAGEAQELVAEG